MLDWLSSIGDWLTQGFSDVVSSVTSGLANVVDTLKGIVTSIIDGFTELLKTLFIPSDEYWKGKFDYLFAKFEWVNSLIDSVNIITDYFTTTDFSQPPKVTLNLTLENSKYDFGDSAVVLDLTWFADYRSMVHRILSGFMWLFFLWNLFKELPSIISGVGNGGVYSNLVDNEMNGG